MKKMFVWLISLSVLWSSLAAEDRVSQSPWKIHYIAGPVHDVESGEECEISIASEKITLTSHDLKNSLQFSPASVIRFEYSEEVRSRASQMPSETGIGDRADLAYDILVWLPVVAVLAPMKTRSRYIRLIWDEEGARQEIILRLDKNNYDAVLAQFRKVLPQHVLQ